VQKGSGSQLMTLTLLAKGTYLIEFDFISLDYS